MPILPARRLFRRKRQGRTRHPFFSVQKIEIHANFSPVISSPFNGMITLRPIVRKTAAPNLKKEQQRRPLRHCVAYGYG